MARVPVFRVTEHDVAELRAQTRDQSIVDAYASWVHRGDELDAVVRYIEESFAELQLGEGIGLLEANGIDDYAGKEELADLRSRDEHSDWRRIDIDALNRCYAAPNFMDARGFVFHIPAFLIAELNDALDVGFIDRLIDAHGVPKEWMPLLNEAQRVAVASALALVIDHPVYRDQADAISLAISRLRGVSS